MGSIFEKISKDHFFELVENCSSFFTIDKDAAYESISEVKREKIADESKNHIKCLEKRWYSSLLNQPDFSVYNDPYYLCDIWCCWTMYSRKSLLSIRAENSLGDRSVLSQMKGVRRVIDLGCGFGYTTAGLKELFPDAEVFGTNIESSYQFTLAKKLAAKRSFEIKGSFEEIGAVDFMFASEYFEHIPNPIEHLCQILMHNNPKYFVIANAFNGIAIGHFKEYSHLGEKYSGREMSKMFNDSMRFYGYKKVKTKIWNSRPAVWVK